MAVRLKSAKDVGSNGGRSARALYLYGLSQPVAGKNSVREKDVAIHANGIDGEKSVKAIEVAGLVAWVSEVDSKKFAADLPSMMDDMEWLSEASVRHQRVVSAIAERVKLLPARFGTVFLGSKSLEADIRSRKKQLEAAFKRIADADEWGIKVFVNTEGPPAMQKATSGKNYLQLKAKAIEAQAKPTADAEIGKLESALQKIARASASTGKVSDGLKNLQWQATFLVPRERRKQWDETLRKFAERWDDSRRIECTGPWPPYSFVGDDS
jgi:hypothetical protein